MKKKPDLWTKAVSIVSGTLIVYQLPVTALLDSMRFSLDQDGGLVLTDKGEFTMDVSESLYKHETHQQQNVLSFFCQDRPFHFPSCFLPRLSVSYDPPWSVQESSA